MRFALTMMIRDVSSLPSIHFGAAPAPHLARRPGEPFDKADLPTLNLPRERRPVPKRRSRARRTSLTSEPTNSVDAAPAGSGLPSSEDKQGAYDLTSIP